MNEAYTKSLTETIQQGDLKKLGLATLLVYIFCIPFQKRIEFYNVETFRYSTFIDYTTVLWYVVDTILVAALLFVVASKLLKKQSPLAVFKSKYSWALLTFVASLTPSLVAHHSPVAFSFFVQILLAVLFSFLAFHFLQASTKPELFLYPLFLSGVFQSVIAITQFIAQKSLGLWFLGESPFTINSLNVAKIVVGEDTYLRAYGTFPHPNVLAVFLGVTLSASLVLLYLRRSVVLKNILRTLVWSIFFLVQLTALLFTFSRTGWIASAFMVGVLGIYLLIQNERHEDDLSTKIKFRSVLVILALTALGVLWMARPFITTRATIADSNGDNAASERNLLINVSRETIPHHFIIGTGLHSFLSQVDSYDANHKVSLANWQHQPVHNIYILVLTESGILGISGFLALLIYFLSTLTSAYKKQPAERRVVLLFAALGVISYLAVGTLDHHPWDIHQSLVTWLLLVGLGIGASQKHV